MEGEALGAGASGTVYRASLTQPVAVKRANVRLSADGTATADDVAYNKRCQALVDGEAAQLGRYGNHPNIVRAVGLIQEAGRLGPSILLELAPHGSLADWMWNKR